MSYKFKGRGFLQLTGKNLMSRFNLTAAQNIPITINGANWNSPNLTVAGQGYSTTFDFESLLNNNHLKKYEMYESTEDIMALSVAAHRLMRDTKIYYKLTERDLYKKVEQQDRDKATEIRNYYSKKVVMLKLRGNGQMSPFREDMNKLIHSDGLVFKETTIGIAYYLPIFYEYDLDLDSVKEQVNTLQNFDDLNKRNVPNIKKISVELTPIKCIKRITKRTKSFEYWMKDSEYNAGVVIQLEEKNQLQHLWDYMFEKESIIKIEGNYIRRKRDGFEYYSINNWTIDRG